MSRVAAHTGMNLLSFGVAAALGVAVIPMLIRRFGLEALGLVAVSRLMLPSGLAALLDLGLAEATARSVAMRRGKGLPAARRELYFSCTLSLVIGVAGGAVLWAA